jgi:hypothetical protein
MDVFFGKIINGVLIMSGVALTFPKKEKALGF